MEQLKKSTILVGDDEREAREYFKTVLGRYGYSVRLAEDGHDVITNFRENGSELSAVLLDVGMPRGDGFEVLRHIRRTDQSIPIIMISGESSPPRVIEAMRSGATDFLGKPVGHETLALTIARALNVECQTGVVIDVAPLSKQDGNLFVGSSMLQVQQLISRIGDADVPVLIQGETGSGKEVVARQLHAQTRRSSKPLLKLNCAALPSELVESELFGYERGAFTGAFQRKAGMFEIANGGTILLDEIGDMDYRLQAKLLQVLQDKEFQRLGGKETVRVDVRVLAATHRDLDEAITEGRFREDLFYRLNVVTINVPPLRDRMSDIVSLAEFLLRRHASPGQSVRISPDMKDTLLQHDWPGNVRELENVMRRYALLRDPQMIIEDLQLKSRKKRRPTENTSIGYRAGAPMLPSAPVILEEVERAKQNSERQLILKTLESLRWNRKQTAQKLGIHYKALLYKMNKLSIDDGSEETATVASAESSIG